MDCSIHLLCLVYEDSLSPPIVNNRWRQAFSCYLYEVIERFLRSFTQRQMFWSGSCVLFHRTILRQLDFLRATHLLPRLRHTCVACHDVMSGARTVGRLSTVGDVAAGPPQTVVPVSEKRAQEPSSCGEATEKLQCRTTPAPGHGIVRRIPPRSDPVCSGYASGQ